MRAGVVTTFLVEHKGFLFRFIIWAVPSLLLMMFGVFVAVFDIRPATHAVVTAITESDIPRLTQKNIVGDAVLDMHAPANLSSAQWSELRDFLATGPGPFGRLDQIREKAKDRHDGTMQYGDFVFTHYGQLPEQTKSDWKLLTKITLDQNLYGGVTIVKEQQTFISRVLTVEEVASILDEKQMYNKVVEEIQTSSTLIDRIMPILISNGLHDDAYTDMGLHHGVCANLKEFLIRDNVDPSFSLSPKSPFSFTMAEIKKQFSQPPISQGATSADRATTRPSQ